MGKMIENYSLEKEIGRGMYSTVYRAIHMKTKQEVAIKQVRAQKFRQYPKLEEGTYNQINILTNLEACPHIIKYFDMLKTVNNYYFVYEYCNGGTLEKLLKEKENQIKKDKGGLPERIALAYFAQIVAAFRVLNKHNIMHRDLKPENLLLHDGLIKLADFGFCKPLENEDQISKTMLGSPIYMAPQILKGENYSIKSDIWSLGVVLFRMLYGFCPFESNNIGKLIMIMEEEDLKIPEYPKVSSEVVKILRRMIMKNPKLRADWSEVFSYEVKNGQLLKQGLVRDLTPKSSMKRSFTLTETTASNNSNANTVQISSRNNHPSIDVNNPSRSSTNDLRTTYSAKSPFRQNFKKDQIVKNHQKCVEILSLAVSLISYEQTEALALAYFLLHNIEKELTAILDSARKEIQIKNDQVMMRTTITLAEAELNDIRTLLNQCKDELRAELDFTVQMIESKKRELLKRFIAFLAKEKIQELVLVSRVVDYIVDQLFIRKEIYEKMSKDKLLSNIKSKTEFFP